MIMVSNQYFDYVVQHNGAVRSVMIVGDYDHHNNSNDYDNDGHRDYDT